MAAKSEGTKGFEWDRAATISSGTPLKHKDKKISPEKRQKFQQLDLNLLMDEFKAVAAESKDVPDTDEEGVSSDPEGAAEEQWMQDAGLGHLSNQIKAGKPITSDDLKEETRGLTAQQVKAVQQRAETLNATLTGTKKAKKSDVRDLFADPGAATGTPSRKEMEEMNQKMKQVPTQFQDLSESDQEQVQCLNLIQLTTLMEQNKIPLLHRPPKKKSKKKKKIDDTATFCVNYATLYERDLKKNKDKIVHDNVPMFFSSLINFLTKRGITEEGIFRKAGSAARIKQLRQKCEDLGGNIDFEAVNARPHDVSALLKQFLRDTPEPLLTNEFIEVFSSTQQLSPEQELYSLQLLCMLLPPINRACLKLFLDFLVIVADNADQNKMGLPNLAVVFAPTLFFMRGQKGQKMLKEVEMQVSTAKTLKALLTNNEELWVVPPDIIAQVRFVNESRMNGRKASRPKDVKRLLGARSKSGKGRSTHTIETVHAPPKVEWVNDSKSNPPVKALVSVVRSDGTIQEKVEVRDNTNVGELLKVVGAAQGEILNEIGGNIGARRLHSSHLVIPLLRINPGLSLVVKEAPP